jgi:enoyl-CoA hydratase/carnithine racemase
LKMGCIFSLSRAHLASKMFNVSRGGFMCRTFAPFLRCGRLFSSSSSSSAHEVLFSRSKGGVLTATLNRPKALNAVNLNMIRLLQQELKALCSDTSAVVLRGEGGKAFCAGGDVVAVVKAAQGSEGGEGRSDPANLSRSFFFEEYVCDYSIARLSERLPTVAVLDGFTMGGGVGLGLPCQFKVATPKTVYAMPETGIGLFCDVGGSYFLPRMQGKAGLYLGLSGARLAGRQVADMGIATHYVEDEEALAGLERRIEGLRDAEEVKAVLDDMAEQPSNAEDTFWGEHGFAIDVAFGHGSVEQIMAALEVSDNEVLQKAHKAMLRASPLSMKIVFEQLRRGGQMDLDAVFQMEYDMSQHFMDQSDFAEGVRALLIDRDNAPQWNPRTLAEVSDSTVQAFFEPLPDKQRLTKDALEAGLV